MEMKGKLMEMKESECFPTSFCTTRPQNRRFVRGFRRFSSHVRKCHACDGICILAPLCAALTMRFAKKTRNMKLRDDANLLRLPHKIDVDALKKHELEPFRTAVTRR